MDLTAYVEKHEFCFDAVLDERVSNDEVFLFCLFIRLQSLIFILFIRFCGALKLKLHSYIFDSVSTSLCRDHGYMEMLLVLLPINVYEKYFEFSLRRNNRTD